jgi:hypothetical protein
MAQDELIAMLAGIIEANTEAMKSVKTSNDSLAESVAGLRRTIQGAQTKIGGELGAVIDKGKNAAAALAREVDAVRESRRKPQ